METYTFLRHFADSWFLIAMLVFFLGTWVFAFWPSLKSARDDAASIPLRDDTAKRQDDHNTAARNTNISKGRDNG